MFTHVRGVVRKYWSEALPVLTFFMIAAILILGISNFTKTQDNSNEQLRELKALAQQQQKTINKLNDNSEEQKQLISEANAHVDCLFNLATVPNHGSLAINAKTCAINQPASSSGGAAGSTKSGVKSAQTPAPSNHPGSPPGSPAPAKPANPVPAPKPLVQRLWSDVTSVF